MAGVWLITLAEVRKSNLGGDMMILLFIIIQFIFASGGSFVIPLSLYIESDGGLLVESSLSFYLLGAPLK